MTLLETLQSTFTEGGFDLDDTIGGLRAGIGAVSPAAADLDPDAIAGAAGRLTDADPDAIGGVVSGVLSVAAEVGTALPAVDDLLAPLVRVVEGAERLTSTDATDLVGAFERAAAAAPGAAGLEGLATPMRALDEARRSPAVDGVLRTASGLVPGGLDLTRPIDLLGGSAGGIVALVKLVGALMATETLSRELSSSTALVASMLDEQQVAALMQRLDTVGESGLAQLVRDADPDSEAMVEVLTPPAVALADATRTAADAIVRGLAFAEATLVHADLDKLGAGLDTAAALLTEGALPAVAALAADARRAIDPLLQVDLGSPADSLDAVWDEVIGLVEDLAAAIDRLDPAALAAPLTDGLASALAALDRIEQLVTETVGAFRSAFQTVRQAIAAVDLRPVAETIRAAFEPIDDALERVQDLVGEAQESIERVAGDVVEAMEDVKRDLGGAAGTVRGAFERVAGAIEALNLDQLQQQLEGGVNQIAGAVRAAQLTPVFDAAVDVMDTTAGIVSAVPLDLLPDDVRTELENAAQPIKQIDFDTAVRDVLVGQLRAILDELDTDVLADVEAAYAEVLEFLEGIDPRGALEQLEREAFDPMIERVRALDPAAVLEPVAGVLDELRAAVSQLDLRGDVLEPLDGAFGELETAFAGLDPAGFVGPLADRVTAVRTDVAGALQLDAWAERLDKADDAVGRLLDRVDLDRLVTLLESAWADLRPGPDAERGPSLVGTLLSGLLEGTGLPVSADSFTTVGRWLGGEAAAAVVHDRLTAAATALETTRAAAQAADLGPVVGRLQPRHRELLDAIRSHPADSLLRTTLEPIVAGASPLDLLGASLDNRARLVAALDEAIAEVQRLAASGRSELDAVARGLREALRPLTAVPDKARAVLVRFGVDPGAGDLRAMLLSVFDTLHPERALRPLVDAVDALKGKLRALVRDGVIQPLQGAIADLQGVLAALDISFLSTELAGIHAEIAAEIAALRPSAVLGPLVDAVETTQQAIVAFDPLGAARTAVTGMQTAITEVADDFRPTHLFEPVLDTYDHVLDVAGGLDVRQLLEPILAALTDTERQLEEGLGRTADALGRLQEALP